MLTMAMRASSHSFFADTVIQPPVKPRSGRQVPANHVSVSVFALYVAFVLHSTHAHSAEAVATKVSTHTAMNNMSNAPLRALFHGSLLLHTAPRFRAVAKW